MISIVPSGVEMLRKLAVVMLPRLAWDDQGAQEPACTWRAVAR
jgi:hypothetical protein